MYKGWKIGTNIMSYINEIIEMKSKYGPNFDLRHSGSNIIFDFAGQKIFKTKSTAGQFMRVLISLGIVTGTKTFYKMDKSVLQEGSFDVFSLNPGETLGDYIAHNLITKATSNFEQKQDALYPSEPKLIYSLLAVFFSYIDQKNEKIINARMDGYSVADLKPYYIDVAILLSNSLLKDDLIQSTIEYVVGLNKQITDIYNEINSTGSRKVDHLHSPYNLERQLMPKAYTYGTFLKDYFTNKVKIEIPVYQRKYIWPEKAITTLLSDIYKAEIDRTHYIGNIIVKSNQSDFEHLYRIIDGQQRITSLILISKAIFDYGKYMNFNIDSLINTKFSLTKLNDGDDGEIQIVESFKRIKGNNDFTAFIDVISSNKNTKSKGSMIIANYNASLNWLSANIVNENEFINLQKNLLNSITWVVINALSSNEYVLFEKLNTGSVPLTTLELFKNYILDVFSTVNKNDEIAQSLFEKYIEEPFSKSKNKDAEVEKFITHFLRVENSKISDDTIFNQFKYLIEQKYIDNNIENNFESILEELGNEINLYHEISTYTKYRNEESWAYPFADFLYMFDGRPIYLPLFARIIKYNIYNIHKPTNIEVNKVREFFRVIEVYEVRLQVAIYRGQSLSTKIEDILSKFDENTSPKELWNLFTGTQASKTGVATIEDLVTALTTKGIENKPAKLIMTRLENYYYLGEKWSIDKEDCKFKLLFDKPAQREHLLPSSWHEHWTKDLESWTNLSGIELESEISKYINYVGNAFPIPSWSNNEIKNSSFEEKVSKLKEKNYQKDICILFRGWDGKLDGIKDKFSFKEIIKRTKQIAKIAREIWKDPY